MFTLEVVEESADVEPFPRWREFEIRHPDMDRAVFVTPSGVDEGTFEGRVRAAVEVLNGNAHQDLALAHKHASVYAAARADRFEGEYWEIRGTEEAKVHDRYCEVAEALGLDLEQRGWGSDADWQRRRLAAAVLDDPSQRFADVAAVLLRARAARRMSSYRKIEIWGVRFFVVRETEFEMLVAARMSLIPIGVEARKAGSGWGVLWLELPAGFHRPEPADRLDPELESMPEGIDSEEDG